jgi:hypothetical protein
VPYHEHGLDGAGRDSNTGSNPVGATTVRRV